MPSGKEPVVRKVKETRPEEDEEPEEVPERPKGPRPLRAAPPEEKKTPSRKYDEVVLAETRTARPTDGSPLGEDTDPAEVIGMGKIGILPKGAAFVEPKKDIPEKAPELTIEEAIQEGPAEEGPDAKLPPPPIPDGAKEVKPPGDLLEDELSGKEQEVEIKEVSIGSDGRKIKVLTVKPKKLPPSTEEGADKMPARPSKGGVRDLSEERVEMPPPKGRVRRTPGLGVDVELDAEAIKKLSAPVLPAEFDYPKKAIHSQFRRYILFFLLPVFFAIIILLAGALSVISLVVLVLLFMVVLFGFLIYGVSPFYTSHMVTRASVVLKHGVYFEARIPLRDIRTVRVYDEKAGTTGIRVDKDRRLFALSDRKDMVEIVLKDRMTVASHHNIESVVTNVESPSTFVRTVKSAAAMVKEDRDPLDMPEGPLASDEKEA
jgi:hypothetical protein